MAITPKQLEEMCQPIFNLKAHIDRQEQRLAQAESERDRALAEVERLRNVIRAAAYALRGTLDEKAAQALLDELGADHD